MNRETPSYLRELSLLHRKIRGFEAAVHLKHSYGPLSNTHRRYIQEDIDTVVHEFSKGFGLDQKEFRALSNALHSDAVDLLMLRDDQEAMEMEEFPVFFILSRPFYRSMRKQVDMDNSFWQEGRCAVCGSVPSVSLLERENMRKYSCTFCGCIGQYKRLGCLYCGNENAEKINIMYPEESTDMRVDTCEVCKSYVKTFKPPLPDKHSLEDIDLISLPLDIVAQNKGYRRRSPNPVGMLRIQ